MKMSAADIKAYPKFTEYVKNRMPECANLPVIQANMKEYGTFSKTQLRHALAWGSLPLVVIKDLGNWQCGVAAANGCFQHSNATQIEIDKQRVDEFESDSSGAGSQMTAYKRSVYIVGTVILHELCHWARHANGQATTYTKGGKTMEAGKGFEIRTYGKDIG